MVFEKLRTIVRTAIPKICEHLRRMEFFARHSQENCLSR
jgi:hypothetical protein